MSKTISGRTIRYTSIFLVLLAATVWSFGSAAGQTQRYPNAGFLATGKWLKEHLNDPNLVIVDVRNDEHFDGRVIPGAVRMPWSLFRMDDPARGIGGAFVGTVRAQKILGEHGLSRIHHIVLYDSVERDGGATASYVFWVLDLLGHRKVSVLERGIDGWAEAGGRVVPETEEPDPVLYQAPSDEIRMERSVEADFIQSRMGDPYYIILDVRSRAEYLGEKLNGALGGGPLKAGHIPTAVNIEYKLNWTDPGSKAIKSISQLREMYAGFDPGLTVITYCHSARRGSFGYFILRLMGFENVALYDPSWFEWGNPDNFYPVETVERELAGSAGLHATGVSARAAPVRGDRGSSPRSPNDGSSGSTSGYVSCGG